MKSKLLLLVILPLIGCVNQNSSSDTSSKQDIIVNEETKHYEDSLQKFLQDSIELVNQKKIENENLRYRIRQDSLKLVTKIQREKEIIELKKKGVFGMWRCDISGYESIITLIKKEGKYSSEIDFTKSNMKTKIEKLKKVGDKFFVVGNKSKEYYKIDGDNNLELGDKLGLFTKAKNIMPGTKIIELPKLDINEVIGQDIFYVAGIYSKSFAKTLEGSNNEDWIVYYKDINVIFKVSKSTNKIISAKYKKQK